MISKIRYSEEKHHVLLINWMIIKWISGNNDFLLSRDAEIDREHDIREVFYYSVPINVQIPVRNFPDLATSPSIFFQDAETIVHQYAACIPLTEARAARMVETMEMVSVSVLNPGSWEAEFSVISRTVKGFPLQIIKESTIATQRATALKFLHVSFFSLNSMCFTKFCWPSKPNSIHENKIGNNFHVITFSCSILVHVLFRSVNVWISALQLTVFSTDTLVQVIIFSNIFLFDHMGAAMRQRLHTIVTAAMVDKEVGAVWSLIFDLWPLIYDITAGLPVRSLRYTLP